jgi:hypothetical protein
VASATHTTSRADSLRSSATGLAQDGTTCTSLDSGLAVETDGNGLGFAEPIQRRSKPCSERQSAEDADYVDIILATETWTVADKERIELTGTHRLGFERVP